MSISKATTQSKDLQKAANANGADKTRRRVVLASLAVLVPGLIAPPRPANGQEVNIQEVGAQEVEQSQDPVFKAPIKAHASNPTLSLDGLAFSGPTGAIGMAPHHEEILEFKDGLLSSSECEKWGFVPAQYKAWTDGSTVRFEARLTSDTYGEITWEGEITNQVVSAKYHWRKKRLFWTLRNSYWFTGEHQG
jgi:hypothetical protein